MREFRFTAGFRFGLRANHMSWSTHLCATALLQHFVGTFIANILEAAQRKTLFKLYFPQIFCFEVDRSESQKRVCVCAISYLLTLAQQVGRLSQPQKEISVT